jgi:hypothetical protein
MIRRFWHSREGGLFAATLAIIGAIIVAAGTITGVAVLMNAIAEAVS